MSILDSITGMMGGQMGQAVEQQVAGMIAQKMGIDPSMAQAAIGALMHNHTLPNNTVDAAAAQTGMSGDMMSQILGHLGGEGALGSLIGQVSGGAQQPDAGGVTGALGGMLGGLMGGTKS